MLFVQSQNIDNYAEALRSELDPGKHETLRRLLVREEYKYGFHAEQLDMALRYISEGHDRIARQRRMVDHLKANGHDTQQADRLLRNLLDIQELFKYFHSSATKALSSCRI
jgi:hypothetical protein